PAWSHLGAQTSECSPAWWAILRRSWRVFAWSWREFCSLTSYDPFGCNGIQRRHHRSPALPKWPPGQDLLSTYSPHDATTVPFCWRRKASLFWILLLLIFAPADHERIE